MLLLAMFLLNKMCIRDRLKILAGIQAPTSGSVSVPRDVTIGYLPQVMILSDRNKV